VTNELLGRCPACSQESRAVASGAGRGMAVRTCPHCGHRFVPADRVDLAAIRGLYRDDCYDGFRPDPAFAAYLRRFVEEELSLRLRPGARVLDVGCGNGEFLAALAETGFEGWGLDVSAAAVEACRRRGLRASEGDLSGGECPGEGPFDAVTLWDVVEHLTEPAACLRRAAALLKPGGFVFVKTPEVRGLSAFLAGALPVMHRVLLSAPAHIQYFTKRSAGAALAASGVERIEYLPSRSTRSANTGGSLRRRLGRRMAGLLRRLSGDGNILAFGWKPSEAPASKD
jgi:2-polyprenyl-3-methyl-5-hydroxy-6-metoxy-1,4-benzoquinol methylase